MNFSTLYNFSTFLQTNIFSCFSLIYITTSGRTEKMVFMNFSEHSHSATRVVETNGVYTTSLTFAMRLVLKNKLKVYHFQVGRPGIKLFPFSQCYMFENCLHAYAFVSSASVDTHTLFFSHIIIVTTVMFPF